MKNAVVLLVVAVGVASAQADQAAVLTALQFGELARHCAPDAPLPTLRSIAEAASGLRPDALTLPYVPAWEADGSIELKRNPRSREESVRWGRWLVSEGVDVRIGLMGVRIQDLEEMVVPLEKALEPCTNIRIGWVLFKRRYDLAATVLGKGQSAARAALQAYEGNTTPRIPPSGFQRITDVAEEEGSAVRPTGRREETAAVLSVPSLEVAKPGPTDPGLRAAAESTEVPVPDPKASATKLEWDLELAKSPWAVMMPVRLP